MRAALMTIVLAALVPDRPNPTPREAWPPHEQIVGDWRIETSPDDRVRRVLRITSGAMLILVDGKSWPDDAFSGACTIDWARRPVAYVNTRRGYPGILQLDGDRLLLCLARSGPRPTDFSEQMGIILRLKRIK